MKVMIAYPPLAGKRFPTLGQNRQFQWFSNPSFIYPMVPASAATLLKHDGHQVFWNDCLATGRSETAFWKDLQEEKPDLVAMETKTPVVRQHWTYAQRIKETLPGAAVVLMGDHVTALPLETMKNAPADFVITGGDYDYSLRSIANHLESGERLEPGIWYRDGDNIQNSGEMNATRYTLDELPWIDRNLTQWQNYGEKLYRRSPFTYTMAGRDCPYGKCTFCSWTTLYPKFRVRSPENVAEEIQFLVTDLGIKEIFDDTGTFPSGGWLERFCENMIRRGLHRRVLFSCNFRYDYLTLERARMMKKAGFRLMKLGLESANQKTLDRLNKDTKVSDIEKGCRIAKEAGLEVHLTMMVGYPWESKSEAMKTVDLAKRLMKSGMASMLQSTIIVPYPGTPLYDEALKNRWFLIDPRDYKELDMSRPVLKTPDMEPFEVKYLCKDIYKSFFSLGYIARQLLSIKRFSDIQYYFRGVKPVLGHIHDFKKNHFKEKEISR